MCESVHLESGSKSRHLSLFLLPIHDFRENGSTCITLRQCVSLSVRHTFVSMITCTQHFFGVLTKFTADKPKHKPWYICTVTLIMIVLSNYESFCVLYTFGWSSQTWQNQEILHLYHDFLLNGHHLSQLVCPPNISYRIGAISLSFKTKDQGQ